MPWCSSPHNGEVTNVTLIRPVKGLRLLVESFVREYNTTHVTGMLCQYGAKNTALTCTEF